MSTYTDRVNARRGRADVASYMLPPLLLGAVAIAVVAFRTWTFLPAGAY